MPVDTKPLNQSRRALMLLFMLVLFLGSIGVARVIVQERRKTISKGFFFDIPAGYEVVKIPRLTPHIPVIGCATQSGDRMFIVFQLQVGGQLTGAQLLEHTKMIYETFSRGTPTANANTRIASFPAIELSGQIGRGFAIATATQMDGRYIAVLYQGATRPVEADRKFFKQLTEESLTFFGSNPQAN